MLVAQVTLRDREVSTVEARERQEREAQRREEEARAEARRREEAARAEDRRREEAARAAEEVRARAEREAKAKREREREAQRQAAIRAHKWPKHIESAVIDGKVMPGMTAEQVTLAWGPPQRVNQTIRASGISEQWVYSLSQYVYFENGRVTVINISR